jgi:hypothetical protein
MKLSTRLLTVSCLFFCTQARSQTLVYSLSYVETRASFRARFANVSPLPGRRSQEENLAMLRHTRKTEIYSVSVADGKRSLLFSDEGMHLETQATGTVSGSGKGSKLRDYDALSTQSRNVLFFAMLQCPPLVIWRSI